MLRKDTLTLTSLNSESHVGQGFVNTFGEALTKLRTLFQTTASESQPFVISGSGTLGWDLVAANLVEPGDEVLVLHTGYFADSFADCFATYGVTATQLKAPIGSRPSVSEIETELGKKKYKMITITHVDTSTGVLSDVQKIAALVHQTSPDTLIVVDGVCSVGSENIEFDNWKLDVVLTASQKGIGVPAGLSISMYSGRAIEAYKSRKSPPASYFGSFKNWLPIMQNYEAKKASYFATPSPQLIHALLTSLNQILARPLSERFAAQHASSQRVKAGIEKLGLKQLATDPECQANGMTAFWLPEGVTLAEVMPQLLKKGVVLAGGLHKQCATKYMRFGHMGVSALDQSRGAELDRAVKAVGDVLAEMNQAEK